MVINVHEQNKIVEIWLTNEEKRDTALRENLRPLYREYKDKKYTVAVFESGEGSLFDNMESLVLHNLKL